MAAGQEAEESVSWELCHPSELRMVLLGRCGAGKSSSGNTILGTEEFRSGFSFSAVTVECEKRTGEVSERRVTVVDTLDLLKANQLEIESWVSLSAPGPHVFLLVIPVYRKGIKDNQSEVWRTAVKNYCKTLYKVQDLLGERSMKHITILFSRGDYLRDWTIEQYIEEAGEEFQQLVEKCGNRYHVLNNKNRSDQTQVTQLLDKIDTMVKENNGSYYTSEMYQEAERRFVLKEQELKHKHKEELSRGEEVMKQKYEEEQRRREEVMKQKYEEELRRREEDMKQKHEEELRRREEEMKQKYEEELRRREEEMKQKYEEELRRREEVMKQKYEEELRRREEVMKQKYEEELRRREEVMKQKYEEELRSREEAMKQKYEEELRRREEAMKQKYEEELRRREELRKRENEMKQKYEEELSRREEAMKQKYEEE
ncbi:GIMA4 GTPase, partial [Polyodon spathula]|nr:GIMA4 GTPase [Polyodon spathula]